MLPNIKELLDPKLNELRAKYENARWAVDKAYTIVGREYTAGSNVKELVNSARHLASYIEIDLNHTLEVLEPNHGLNAGKTTDSEVSRPS